VVTPQQVKFHRAAVEERFLDKIVTISSYFQFNPILIGNVSERKLV
jgi:hypothetical protein